MSINADSARKARILEILKDRRARLHFIGIYGSGMLPLALHLFGLGYSISGSDIRADGQQLPDGVTVYNGHSPKNVRGANIVVFSFAISKDCSELLEAERCGIFTVTRAELLGAIMQEYLCPIGVSGTHGKSTTTAMLAEIFTEALLEPTVISGAHLTDGSPYRAGKTDYLIYEACEYRDAFLSFSPRAAVILSIEMDHVDYFKDLWQMLLSYLSSLKTCSLVAVNACDAGCRTLLPLLGERAISFGEGEGCDYRYEIIYKDKSGSSVRIYHKDGATEVHLPVPGMAALIDAVGAFSLARSLGISDTVIARALSGFCGIDRRMQHIASLGNKEVYYDYAHHPTEISATLCTLKERDNGLTVVFRPHTFSRTEALFEGFVSSLSLADEVIILDVFAARESDSYGRGSRELAEALGARFMSEEDALDAIIRESCGTIVLMGAGDISYLRDSIIGLSQPK